MRLLIVLWGTHSLLWLGKLFVWQLFGCSEFFQSSHGVEHTARGSLLGMCASCMVP